MSEMDLVPQSYRAYLQMYRALKQFAIVTAGVFMLSALVYGTLEHLIREDHKAIQVLEKKKAISSQQRLVLERLQSQRKRMAGRLSVLEHLRGGASARDMFIAVDRALDGHTVWFTDWSFLRAGVSVPREPHSVNTGYFIVIPKGQEPGAEPAWQIQTHMEIAGQAKDHAALSEFVQRLLEQPQIGNVRILSTHLHPDTEVTVVDFELAVIVNNNLART